MLFLSMYSVYGRVKKDSLQLSIAEEYSPVPIDTSYSRVHYFALKSNLLYDAVTVLNVKGEVPIGRRFSIEADWTFPWWLWEKEQNCIQILAGGVEARYWFGNRYNEWLRRSASPSGGGE